MPTPAAKNPAKKTPLTEAGEPKPKPEQDAKAHRPEDGPEGAAPRKGAVKKAVAVKAELTPKAKKAPAKKAEAAAAVEVPLIVAEDVIVPVAVTEKPTRGRRPAKVTELEPVVEAPAPSAPEVGVPKAAAGVPAHAETILEALREKRPLEFIFADGDANPPRTFEPRQLIFDTLSQAWFVWGWDRRYNAERHHRIDALAEVNQVEGMGRSAQGPYKEGTPANLLGGWLGGEPIPVKATLMKQWIFAVKQAPPAFPEFKITDAEDGKATVSFTATDLRAISRWCMQFGDGIQIQEPQRLVERLKQAGIAWAGKPAQAAVPASTSAPSKHAPRHEAAAGTEAHQPKVGPSPRQEPRDTVQEHGPEGARPTMGRVKGGAQGGSDAASEASGSAHRARPAEGRREERHREERHDYKRDREESKPAKASPKIEVRVERL